MKNKEGQQSLQDSLTGLPEWTSERVMQQIRQLTNYEPAIGIMGKTGAGKSSLCNALFAGEVSPVSDVAACTREPLRFRLLVGDRHMTLVDLPGVGESGARDNEYAALYREQLPRLDLVLWLIKADDRALAVDEHFYHQVIGEAYRHKVLFVISQSDKVEPTSGGGPLSKEQKQNISRKICLLHELFQPVHPVCAVSVRLQWGLRVMAERMIKCLPREATSPVVSQLQPSFRTTVVREQARSDFGETVGAVLDSISAFPLMPEIILLNSHDGTSSYQMLPGLFRAVCQNGLVCGESFGEVRVPHKGDVVSQVIEGAYEVLGIFDRVKEKRDAMQSLLLPPPAQQALAKAALTYRFGEDHQPVTESQILSPRRWQDESNDLWTTYQRIQENLIKGGLSGRNAKGGRSHTRAVRGIDGDVKLNRALWVMAEALLTQLQ